MIVEAWANALALALTINLVLIQFAAFAYGFILWGRIKRRWRGKSR